MSETVSTFFESGLLLKPLKKSLVALQEVCWKKKNDLFAICRTVSTHISQFSYWSNPVNGTLNPPLCSQSLYRLSQSCWGLTRTEPNLNSTAKAGIGCMTNTYGWRHETLWKGHLAQNSWNWVELCSRPLLNSTIDWNNNFTV